MIERKRLLFIAKITVTMIAVGWLIHAVDMRLVMSSLARVTWFSFALALLLTFAGVVVGVFRWRALLVAYGAERVLPFGEALRLYLVATFYNTWLPGAVGGDVVRGVATRECFGEHGSVRALAVVLVERVLGLAGLLTLTALLVYAKPLTSQVPILMGSLVGLAIAATLVLIVSQGHRIGPRMPKRFAEKISSLPRIRQTRPFAAAILLSIATQLFAPLCAHAFMRDLEPTVSIASTLAVFPIVTAAAYFPFSINGAGVRESASVYLYALVGVNEASAVAVSLLVFAAQAVVGASGGIMQLFPAARPKVA